MDLTSWERVGSNLRRDATRGENQKCFHEIMPHDLPHAKICGITRTIIKWQWTVQKSEEGEAAVCVGVKKVEFWEYIMSRYTTIWKLRRSSSCSIASAAKSSSTSTSRTLIPSHLCDAWAEVLTNNIFVISNEPHMQLLLFRKLIGTYGHPLRLVSLSLTERKFVWCQQEALFLVLLKRYAFIPALQAASHTLGSGAPRNAIRHWNHTPGTITIKKFRIK